MKLRIKELCKERNLLLKDLAKKLDITDIGLMKSLKGGKIPLNRLEDIAVILEVDIIDLFVRESESDIFGVIVFRGVTYQINNEDGLKKLLADYLDANKPA